MENLIYYSDNPCLDKNTIVTFNGEKEYRVNCRKIKGEYYVIGKSCFNINGMWYRINSGLIALDHEYGKMVIIKESDLIKGVVDIQQSNPVIGYFSPNVYKNVKVCFGSIKSDDILTCISEELLIGSGFIENFSTGVWYNPRIVNVSMLQKPANVVNNTLKGYNIEDNAVEFSMKKKYYEEYKPDLTKDVRQYGRMLKDTTFGLEIECSKGYLPEHIQNRTGIVICRDGSLNDENGMPGPEFVTVPMSGAKGLQTISDLAKELSKRTVIDYKCSLHIHFGNLPTSRMFLISLYRLAFKIQNEIFQMFPFYKTNPEGIKSKNYNQKLPILNVLNIPSTLGKDDFLEKIDIAYRSMFSWLAEGYHPDGEYNRKTKRHPVNQKWNRKSRYYWINFMNTIFSNRNTVEFRLHTPTTNVQKIINWLFICNAILHYANINCRKILTEDYDITLGDIMSYYKSFGHRGRMLAEYLTAYIDERKQIILGDVLRGDKLSAWDIEKDKDYVFNYNGITYLF